MSATIIDLAEKRRERYRKEKRPGTHPLALASADVWQMPTVWATLGEVVTFTLANWMLSQGGLTEELHETALAAIARMKNRAGKNRPGASGRIAETLRLTTEKIRLTGEAAKRMTEKMLPIRDLAGDVTEIRHLNEEARSCFSAASVALAKKR